jgi:hypothetical protein
MTNRGRPRTNGARSGNKLAQISTVVFTFDKARAAGKKRAVAKEEAVAVAKAKFPGMAISVTEVNRILAKWRPRGMTEGLRFEERVLSVPQAVELRGMMLLAEKLNGVRINCLEPRDQCPSIVALTCYAGGITPHRRSNASSRPRKGPLDYPK